MLSRLRKLLHLQPYSSNCGDTSANKEMPFITGSQPWLKPYILAALAHPPNPPSLNAHYLQAVSPVSTRREITVYDGRFIIPAVLSLSAASLLDADEDDTGVTTRNLLGHVLAPVSVIVVPDMATAPPTATLLIKEIRVFADRVHQRPVGHVPFVYTDPEVCDALRAIVGRHLASYATATVLERADRAAEIQIDDPPETDTFFEKLLHDPSIPQSHLLSDSETFVMHARRGMVVGGGAGASIGDDDHEPLDIIPENPTPPDADQTKKPNENATPAGSQSNHHDPGWEINFTQDPAEGGGSQNVAADNLPQTQHFAIDDDDEDEDDGGDDDEPDDNEDSDYDVAKDTNNDADSSGIDERKSIGEQGMQGKFGNTQEDTPDEQQLSPTTKSRNQTGEQSPSDERTPNSKRVMTRLQSMNKASVENVRDDIPKNKKTSQKRMRSMETIKVKEGSPNPPHANANRSTDSGTKADKPTIDKEPQPRSSKPLQPSRAPQRDKQGVVDKLLESPSPITRSAARSMATSSRRRKVDEDRGANKKTIDKDGREEAMNVSPRRSPRNLKAKTPPRRRQSAGEPGLEPSDEVGHVSPRRSPRIVEMKTTPPPRQRSREEHEQIPTEDEPMPMDSPRTPLRRSSRVRHEQSPSTPVTPLTRLQARRASQSGSPLLKEPNYKEDEKETDDTSILPKAKEKNYSEKKIENKAKQDNQSKTLLNGQSVESSRVSLPEETDPVNSEGVERGTKRKALEVSSPDKIGPSKRREEEEPSSYSPEPFLDKIKAEMEEMKRFRDRIDRNPDGYKTYPDGFLPSAKPANLSVQRILKFPPPSQKNKQVLDVPESAPM